MRFLLILMCLLLCGCASETTKTEPPLPSATTAPSEIKPASMYAPDHYLEKQYDGALKVYPLTMRKVQGIRAIGDDLLVFSGYGSTNLTVLEEGELIPTASLTLDFELDPRDPSLQITGEILSYFDPVQREVVVLNRELEVLHRVPMQDNMIGSPVLSQDRKTVYYCTPNAVMAWNLDSSIHRTVKDMTYEAQTILGLHLKDTVLQCLIQDGTTEKTLFLSVKTGQLLYQHKGNVTTRTHEDGFYAELPIGEANRLVFGNTFGQTMALYPEDPAADSFYLPHLNSVVTSSILEDEHIQLRCYSLDTGHKQAALTLEPLQYPKSIVSTSNGAVYILFYEPANDCHVIYRWDLTSPVFVPQDNDQIYTHAYPSAESIDVQKRSACEQQAYQLSEKYGIEILIGENAAAKQPWDYEFNPETIPQVMQQELTLLDQRLSRYPQIILTETASHFSSLKLCLVREIAGTAASGSLAKATGVQFYDGSDAYVVIAAGKYSEQALYHELYHAMETHILNESSAMDQWNEWNPDGFEYSYGYGAVDEDSQYLSGENRAFVDAYSMTFPKEDRARIFENAMLPGNAELFASQTMQRKLRAVCESIRDAYGLRKSEETFPWEQYLTIESS